jgi:hypothetical protein
MSDITKKFRKWARSMQTAIAVETSDDLLNDLSKTFSTVFVFSVNPPGIKKRNIIYRELVENVDQIPEVGFICVGVEGIVHIPALQTIFQHHKPTLMIRSGEYPSKKISRWLNEHVRYEMVDIAKHHQLWKIKQ